MRVALRHTLLFRLLVAYLLPTLALLLVFAYLAQYHARHALEDSLGRRLIDVAQAATTQISPAVIQFLGSGDDKTLSAKRLRHKLAQLRQRTRVARILVLDPTLRTKADTVPTARIGDKHYHAEADRAELRRVFAGHPASSVLFRGNDGRTYKTGYAPLTADGKVIAAVAVEGSAAFFRTIERLRSHLLLLGSVIALLVISTTLLLARRITRPLVTLAGEAARIGAGDLEQPIAARGGAEVSLLARTMNDMRRDLRAREEETQLMLSGIAHEVRNPLGGIALFAGLLREEVEHDADQLEMVQRIERELEYLKRVVNDFLSYARRMPITLKPQQLEGLLAEVAQLCSADAEVAGVAVTTSTEATCAMADEEQLRRVMLNLVNNAIQACETGGRVDLRCGKRDGRPYFAIEDDGSGIPEDVAQKVFSPFFTTREKGTGLGMALSQKVISEHGGELELETAVGEGTTIHVWLKPCKTT